MENPTKIVFDTAQFWKGYYKYESAIGEGFPLFEGEKIEGDGYVTGEMSLVILFKSDGRVLGRGQDPYGPFSIQGTHDNLQTIKFTKKMETELSWEIKYSGNIKEGSILEGTFLVDYEGPFRFWLDEEKNQDVLQHKVESDTPILFSGIRELKEGMNMIDFQLIFSSMGTISGKGADQTQNILVKGQHENLKNITLRIELGDKSIIDTQCNLSGCILLCKYKLDNEDRRIILWANFEQNI